jgi:hypothetical protein
MDRTKTACSSRAAEFQIRAAGRVIMPGSRKSSLMLEEARALTCNGGSLMRCRHLIAVYWAGRTLQQFLSVGILTLYKGFIDTAHISLALIVTVAYVCALLHS